ncbi:putative ascorbate peroxidase [Lingula anatina]|uniref:Ascorbate peroxidase n=1 Tax=Lingula anatina TaxID=7574 RepID=A0A1S3JQD7_LINAN|nr:putative ascorbate peroxidase [Lingula anatina]|eukprot:XP_013412179.1 putative ascorbate peroxidase [Lingula anatina]
MKVNGLKVAFLFILSLDGLCAHFTYLTQHQVSYTKTLLSRLMMNTVDTKNGETFHPIIAGSVRLGFHDCVGGCDGCINLNNPDNAGLDTTFNALNDLYARERIDQIMSRADFFALAGIVGAEVGSKMKYGMGPMQSRRMPYFAFNRSPYFGFRGLFYGFPHHYRYKRHFYGFWRPRFSTRCFTSPCIPFRWGRRDCPTSPITTEMRVFPNALGNLTETVDYFRRVFDLTPEQLAAVLGAHTLGDAGKDASGFDGEWVTERDVFDNEFYRVLSDQTQLWMQENENPDDPNKPRWQWNAKKGKEGEKGLMMLNTDMELFKNTAPNSEGRVTSCPADVSTCPSSRLADRVKLYASNNAKFLDDFSVAYGKMLTTGYKSWELRYPSLY